MSARTRLVAGDADAGAPVERLAERAGDARAVAEGRAFVNGRRASAGDRVAAGDVLEVYGARAAPAGAAEVLFVGDGLVVASKPAGLPTTAERRGARSLVAELERRFGAAVHPASRLDVGVSGVVLCAVGEDARRHVARLKEAGRVRRTYVAIAGGEVRGEGLWNAPIGTARAAGRRSVVAGGAAAEPAETRYAAIAHARGPRPGAGASTLLRLEPITGRTHQLRIHASLAGAPLLGDRDHGGARAIVTATGAVRPLDRVALHALSVELEDARGEPLFVTADIPDELRAMWQALESDPASWSAISVTPAAHR